ncbi:hypothetical protein Golob_020361 [Gossypium lobatum]|uniref:RNase H type-1 domain-containing protein n=1 Tax=Gossypium lobatum TaxID=34289 RepID=A0A7J8LA44_9ROSI|nr:hypothetical protein [Gossypium lobatum]
MVRNACCPVCKEDEETVAHLFRDCKFTRKILQDLRIEDSTSDRKQERQNWLVDFFYENESKKCRTLMISFWAIWFNRNRIYHEGQTPNEQEVISFINAYLSENDFIEGVFMTRTMPKNIKWEPPDRNLIKINFDASFQQSLNISKAGIIARNKNGLIMAACIYPFLNISTPELPKAWACLHAVTFGEELGFKEICVDGDALTIIKGVTATGEDRSCISNVIKAVQNKGANFTKRTFRFVPRSATLAKEGRSYEWPKYWIKEAPNSVEDIVNKERIGFENE